MSVSYTTSIEIEKAVVVEFCASMGCCEKMARQISSPFPPLLFPFTVPVLLSTPLGEDSEDGSSLVEPVLAPDPSVSVLSPDDPLLTGDGVGGATLSGAPLLVPVSLLAEDSTPFLLLFLNKELPPMTPTLSFFDFFE